MALQWFLRGVGTLDPEDRRAFDDWWAADPSHAAAWARWAEDWSQLDALPAEGLQHLRHRLAQDKARAAARRPWAAPLRFLAGGFHGAWGRPAFALASLCLVVASGWLGWSHWQQQPVFVQTVATGFGQQSEVQLPDGSTLRLDTRTRLDVTFRRQRREVILPGGQALFRVQGDTARPFDVVAGRCASPWWAPGFLCATRQACRVKRASALRWKKAGCGWRVLTLQTPPRWWS